MLGGTQIEIFDVWDMQMGEGLDGLDAIAPQVKKVEVGEVNMSDLLHYFYLPIVPYIIHL
jgi:hypothetical protein